MAYWLNAVKLRMSTLSSLEDGWDGYDSAPVHPHFADAVMRYLSDPLWASTLRPRIVPTANGGLSVEWSSQNAVLELEFTPQGVVEAYVFDRVTNVEWEGDASAVPDGLEKWVWRVTNG